MGRTGKILILGATGYLGGRLARHFVAKGEAVILHGRNLAPLRERFKGPSVAFLEGDLARESCLKDIEALGADVVINTVSLNHHQTGQDIAQTAQINILPTYHLLERLAKKTKTYVYLSTQQVYGKTGPVKITEDTPCRPVNHYGLTHLLAEQIVDYYHANAPVAAVNLRLSNGYGAPLSREADCWWLVVNDFCKSAVESGQIIIQSDGTPQRDFVAIADVCRAVELLLGIPKDKLPFNRFHVGGGRTFTIAETAAAVAALYSARYGRPARILDREGDLFDRAGSGPESPRFAYDISRLAALGYAPTAGLDAGAAELFDFLDGSQT